MRRLKLSIKLPALIVASVLLTAIAISLLVTVILSEFLVNQAQQVNLQAVQIYASAVQNYLNDARSTLDMAIKQEELTDYIPDVPVDPMLHGLGEEASPATRRVLRDIMASTKAFEYVALLHGNGTVVMLEPYSLQVKLSTGSLSFTKWYGQLSSTGQRVISDLNISPVTQQPTIVIATPVRDAAGHIVSILIGGLQLKELSQIGLSGDQQLPTSYMGYITDHRGLIIAHQANSSYALNQTDFSSVAAVQAALAGKSGSARYLNPVEQVEKLGAYLPLDNPPWAVVYSVPSAVALAPVRELALNTIWVALGIVLILGLLSIGVVRQITLPLSALTSAANRIAAGDLTAHVPEKSRDELGTLGAVFNQMAGALAKEKTQLRDRLERLYAQTSDLMCTIGFDGYYRDINPAFVTLFGYSREELLSKPLIEFIHPDDRKTMLAAMVRLTEGQAVNGLENRALCVNSAWKWLSWSATSDLDGGWIYAVARDLTERKQAENEIKFLNASLEQRVIERTTQLQVANQELESFTYSVSHDLRSPLRGIDGWSQALLEVKSAQLDDEGRHYLSIIRAETRRMGELIDGLLRLSRVSRSEMELRPTDISALAQTITERLQSERTDHPIEFLIQRGLTARADGQLLEIVLTNLLDNACKFSARQSAPRVEIGATCVDGRQAFYVRDNGAGFDMAYASKLFGVFQRLHKQSEFSGTGIGLATVQRIIHRHGGIIWADAKVNAGATFYFTIEETP